MRKDQGGKSTDGSGGQWKFLGQWSCGKKKILRALARPTNDRPANQCGNLLSGLLARAAAQGFIPDVLVTPASFGAIETANGNDDEAGIQEYCQEFARGLPGTNKNQPTIILGVDFIFDGNSVRQYACVFSSGEASPVIVEKSFPAGGEEGFLRSIGGPFRRRINDLGVLVCHDAVAFQGRSIRRRGIRRRQWAEQIETDLNQGGKPELLLDLAHFFDNHRQSSGAIRQGMNKLIDRQAQTGVIAFGHDPCEINWAKQLERIRHNTVIGSGVTIQDWFLQRGIDQ